jgi:hypothetical protein
VKTKITIQNPSQKGIDFIKEQLIRKMEKQQKMMDFIKSISSIKTKGEVGLK